MATAHRIIDSPGTEIPVTTSASQMQVRKRNGALEPADVNKIVRAVERCCTGLRSVDAIRIASKTIGGLFDGATTRELDQLSIQTAASLIAEEPEYSKLAARLLNNFIEKEVENQDVHSFSQSIALGKQHGLVAKDLALFVATNARKLNDAIDDERSDLFEYFGLRTVYDRYLLRHPETRHAIETPQQFFLRVASGLSRTVHEAVEFYRVISAHDYMPSSPTLFNSGTRHAQMSSCYLLDSPADNLEAIYEKYKDVALLSKFAGGIGLAYHRVRSRGSLIRATNGHSKGIVPWLKTLDSSVAAVNQGGKRKGACCVYLESWHADIEEFLELRENTGDNAQRTYNLNLANWIPDLFMKRVEADAMWSLFDPKETPQFPDLTGAAFEAAYVKAENEKLFTRQLKARDLYARMMKVLAETGNGWMTFKDSCNEKSNQTAQAWQRDPSLESLHRDHRSQLAPGNRRLQSRLDPSRQARDRERLRLREAGAHRPHRREISRSRHRHQFLPNRCGRRVESQVAPGGPRRNGPAGRVLLAAFALRFSGRARNLAPRAGRNLLPRARCVLRARRRIRPRILRLPIRARPKACSSSITGASRPKIPRAGMRSAQRIRTHGLRNSLLIAIAPTATIASIVGAYECIEPQVSNLFKRETLSGDFLQMNRYLVIELKRLGLWNEAMRNRLKMSDGSVQGIARNSRRCARRVPHRVGNSDALADRYGRRPRRIHRPEPVAESFRPLAQHR